MPEEPPPPDPNLIYSLYLGVYKPQALRIALLLDLFSPLADGFFSLVMGAGSGGRSIRSPSTRAGWPGRALNASSRSARRGHRPEEAKRVMKGGAMDNKVMLITGASAGIGLACADHFHARGWRVYGTSRSIRQSDHPFATLTMDVTEDESVEQGIAHILNLEGRIDGVINCAGYSLAGAIEDTSLAEAKAQFETNFYGTLRVCQGVLPVMRQQRSGVLIVIGSLAGVVALPFQGVYSASKFALEGLCEALRMEVKPFGIWVVLVQPGNFHTKFTENRQRAVASMTNPTYRRVFERSLAAMEKTEINGASPAIIAQRIERILSDPRPGLRYTTGFFSERLGAAAKKFMPEWLYEWLAIRVFELGK